MGAQRLNCPSRYPGAVGGFRGGRRTAARRPYFSPMTSPAAGAPPLPSPVAIVGAGRLGRALAAGLRANGVSVVGPLGRGEPVGDAPVVLLCVPDAAIGDAARALTGGRLVGHCAGAESLEPLAPHEGFSLHPLLAVTGEGTRFEGAACAVDATTPRARAVAIALASTLGMRAISVSPVDRPLYHAAASLAANYAVALESAAARLFAEVGVAREDFAPLVRAAVDAWIAQGPAALTGPVARGDEATVQRQRAAIAARAPGVLPLWDALTDATRMLVRP